MSKPPMPATPMEPFPRIAIDESEGSPFGRALRLAVFAADLWAFGSEGPFKNPGQTKSETARGQVREALLHLLELGIVDLDEERLLNANGWPVSRESGRP